ncbi:MAG TPA: di-heme oxidoredictase family protein [Stellaceae bacterium]|nr:di-heme oxidoredictase family protein [Stellaceae bacterium]
MGTRLSRTLSFAALTIACFLASTALDAALANGSGPFDPGVRGGVAAGGPLPGLDAAEQAFFAAGKTVFQEIDSVSGTIPGENGVGLGPRFNMNSCAGCHAFPTTGGTSPRVNPQVAVATLDGARNVVPPFITANGPVREARFVENLDETPDGGVHDLFVITGRKDAPGCDISQPDFRTQLFNNNVIFRIPTPTFGAGLVENVPDANLQAAISAQRRLAGSLGISGEFNHSGNDGTITRFGWKAQNKSLLIFAGEAYNVEQGVTNEAFPNERENDADCQFNGLPEDGTNLAPAETGSSPASAFSSDVVNFAAFMRLSNAPTPAQPTASTTNGFRVFQNIGCQGCHIVSQTTAKSRFTGQSEQTFQPFSDFAVHAMGALGDGISQGSANGQEFRSAPLWGVGQRIFFLHDGRTSNIIAAIEAHSSNGSEANGVIRNFNALSPGNQQDLINFLRSL